MIFPYATLHKPKQAQQSTCTAQTRVPYLQKPSKPVAAGPKTLPWAPQTHATMEKPQFFHLKNPVV